VAAFDAKAQEALCAAKCDERGARPDRLGASVQPERIVALDIGEQQRWAPVRGAAKVVGSAVKRCARVWMHLGELP
jgi:hypothetical protein